MTSLLVECVLALLLSAHGSIDRDRYHDKEVSYWTATKSGGLTFVLELRRSGAVRFIPETGVLSKGTWERAATKVEMRLNRGFLKLSATIEGDMMNGVATTRMGDKWTWSATRQPRVVQAVAPAYPPLAAAAMVGDAVLIDVEIDSKGTVTSIRPTKGHPLLREAASVAARQYKFEPADPGVIRKARLTFSFRRMPVAREEDTAPLILSPFHVALRYRPPILEKSYKRVSTNAVE